MRCETGMVPCPPEMSAAVDDVINERGRQNETFGEQNHHPAYWLALLGKQMGQLGEKVVDREWSNPENRRRITELVREEAVQLAAVAVAMVEAIDRGKMPVGLTTATPSNPRQMARALGRGDEAVNYED